MKILISTTCICLILTNILGAQQIIAGELNRASMGYQSATVNVHIATLDTYIEDRIIDWGDGTKDTLNTLLLRNDSDGNFVSNLGGTHEYPDTGFYTISIENLGNWAPGISNIENSGEKEFVLSEVVYAKSTSEAKNDAPQCLLNFNWLEQDEDGIVYHEVVGSILPFGSLDSISYEFVPATEEGYSFPEATNEIRCCIYWDKPIEEGLYALAVKMNGWLNGEMAESLTRYMTIQVTPDLVVSNSDLFPLLNDLVIFPNPTTSTLHLQLKHAQSTQGKLLIENLAGQTLHTEALNLSPALQSWQVDVADWPSGVYVVRLLAGSEQVVRKFVKK
jgi:hypothetical protein